MCKMLLNQLPHYKKTQVRTLWVCAKNFSKNSAENNWKPTMYEISQSLDQSPMEQYTEVHFYIFDYSIK